MHSLAHSLAALALVVLPPILHAQAPADDSPRRILERRLAAADSIVRSTSTPTADRERSARDAAIIRERLRDGDFQVGDRVIVRVRALAAQRDTFTVHTGRVLRLPEVPEIPLAGVLSTELQSHLTRQLAAYVRDPQVEAYALMRLAMLGQITRPGFYFFPVDMTLNDAVMAAGGPTGEADLAKSVVRRGSADLLERVTVAEALRSGRTLEQLNLRAGDEVVVGKRSGGFNVSLALQMLAGLTAVVALVTTLGNR